MPCHVHSIPCRRNPMASPKAESARDRQSNIIPTSSAKFKCAFLSSPLLGVVCYTAALYKVIGMYAYAVAAFLFLLRIRCKPVQSNNNDSSYQLGPLAQSTQCSFATAIVELHPRAIYNGKLDLTSLPSAPIAYNIPFQGYELARDHASTGPQYSALFRILRPAGCSYEYCILLRARGS